MPPIVGLPACARRYPDYLQHAVAEQYVAAVRDGAGAVPVLLPPLGPPAEALLDRLDGLLLPGSESNVAPALYGEARDATPGQHDPARDATTLPLIRLALARGMPVLAICRGHQELNVALGGTLHQAVHALPGRLDHRENPAAEEAAQWAPAHDLALSGTLAALLGRATVRVNSLHGQAIDRLGAGLVAEALAPDGTIEAVRAESAGFCVGVQWHPERGDASTMASAALFAAFGAACRDYAARQGRGEQG
ncbi:MAG: gamma-glutamyl-gamma-aminobutyrate hydrolase family protein [Janthinobacterium lividum]